MDRRPLNLAERANDMYVDPALRQVPGQHAQADLNARYIAVARIGAVDADGPPIASRMSAAWLGLAVCCQSFFPLKPEVLPGRRECRDGGQTRSPEARWRALITARTGA